MSNPITISKEPVVSSFFDPITFTVTHVVSDPETHEAAIIDSVMDYDPSSGRMSSESADAIIEHIRAHALTVMWHLETHIHADHLSAAPYLQGMLGGTLGIGKRILEVQDTFGTVFNAGTEFARDGSQFDHLWNDGEEFMLGSISVRVMFTPGHTPADVTYLIGDTAFIGDTLFMPDYGSARCDFPGGDARMLYNSVQKLYELPDETRLFMCHDYLPEGRTEYAWETTVGAEKNNNVHLKTSIDEQAFVAMREARDSTLSMPRLIIPSIQVNMRAGELPPAEDNGTHYLKVPVNGAFGKRVA
jgi:glyoxylase-like metal-dependent hydrolase (beta-lactamase superfamily II)